MRKYWDDEQVYSQPSESLLKKNAGESIKKEKRCIRLSFQAESLPKAGGELHGVRIWNDMRTMLPDWNGGSDMSEVGLLLI